MANATAIVKKRSVRRTEEFMKRSTETLASETRFYRGAMVGIDTTGYYCKGDDTQAWIFAGIVRGQEGDPLVPAGTAGAADLELDVQRPQMFELAIASVAVTDIGKKVYASDDQTGTLANTGTFANFVGHVVDVTASGIALVEPSYAGIGSNEKYGVARTTAATGTQTLTRFDIGRTIFVPNTATLTVIPPAVADTQAGDKIRIVKSHASDTNAITIDPPSSETIDGATTLATLDAPYDAVELVSTGAAWVVLNRDIA